MSVTDQDYMNGNANCYAFAAKCPNPTGSGTAKPANASYGGGGLAQYVADLKAGVLQDGNGNVRTEDSWTRPVNGLGVEDIPTARADHYLIAMLVRSSGFHFVRRQRKSFWGEPYWKWKQGNYGIVERSAHDKVQKKAVKITNREFPALVNGEYVTEIPGYSGWITIVFFEVHKDGFQVTCS